MVNYSKNMLRNLTLFILLLVVTAACTKTTDVVDNSAADKVTIDKYLADNNLTDSAQFTSTGLCYIISKPGGSYHANLKSAVLVMYRGYLTDGTVFDQSTYTYNNPTTFLLSSTTLIAGWKEGMQLVGVGGKIKLLIPSGLAYKDVAQTLIPANSVLIFDIDLRDIYNK
jgi:FKBP-type peptidyl-prolyl cis-trans isomerase FkpA